MAGLFQVFHVEYFITAHLNASLSKWTLWLNFHTWTSKLQDSFTIFATQYSELLLICGVDSIMMCQKTELTVSPISSSTRICRNTPWQAFANRTWPRSVYNALCGRQKDLNTSPAFSLPVLIDTFNFQGAVTKAHWPWLCNQGACSQRLSNERVH